MVIVGLVYKCHIMPCNRLIATYIAKKVNDIAYNMKLNSKRVEKRLYKGKQKLRKLLINKGINI